MNLRITKVARQEKSWRCLRLASGHTQRARDGSGASIAGTQIESPCIWKTVRTCASILKKSMGRHQQLRAMKSNSLHRPLMRQLQKWPMRCVLFGPKRQRLPGHQMMHGLASRQRPTRAQLLHGPSRCCLSFGSPKDSLDGSFKRLSRYCRLEMQGTAQLSKPPSISWLMSQAFCGPFGPDLGDLDTSGGQRGEQNPSVDQAIRLVGVEHGERHSRHRRHDDSLLQRHA